MNFVYTIDFTLCAISILIYFQLFQFSVLVRYVFSTFYILYLCMSRKDVINTIRLNIFPLKYKKECFCYSRLLFLLLACN